MEPNFSGRACGLPLYVVPKSNEMTRRGFLWPPAACGRGLRGSMFAVGAAAGGGGGVIGETDGDLRADGEAEAPSVLEDTEDRRGGADWASREVIVYAGGALSPSRSLFR